MKSLSLLVLFTVLFSSGCGIAAAARASDNKSRMLNLELGMTKDSVLKVMDKPDKNEAYRVKGNVFDVWYYRIDAWTDQPFMPLVFVNGKLDGWGQKYYDEMPQLKIESEH